MRQLVINGPDKHPGANFMTHKGQNKRYSNDFILGNKYFESACIVPNYWSRLKIVPWFWEGKFFGKVGIFAKIELTILSLNVHAQWHLAKNYTFHSPKIWEFASYSTCTCINVYLHVFLFACRFLKYGDRKKIASELKVLMLFFKNILQSL